MKHAAPRDDASLDDWLAFISQIHLREIELGLERVSLVASRLGLSKPAPKVITVAGTNGKGST
ncbi:bifunctional tetrahydrofolate synthase/dihydrofolate synthase, partial [Gammaproteobacteria bacterium]|nr:bifunctional tetrahydrofolate synthase/dihydrofolate synthase [Gammaproteobacteria bacterium]